MSEKKFVIIGGGLAAAKAAQQLRSDGFDGSVTLISAEKYLPYQRPPLSKGILSGNEPDEAIYVHPEQWYADNDVTLKLGTRALSIDPETRTVALSDESDVPYDKLLLATGSGPRKLRVDGTDLGGVHYLRTKGNADQLKAALVGGGKNVVMIGGGWIGLEVAAAARTYGNNVTIIDPMPVPLYAALGRELGGVFADLHTENGATLLMNRGVSEIIGDGTQVTAVKTDDNETVPADVVVIGIGTVPMAFLAEKAGLNVDNGIVVTDAMQTSDPHIFAAGDIARWEHPVLGRPIRVEHWANALNSGPAAAKSMLGQDVSYGDLPYFYTDQYDLGMEFIGDLAGDVAAKNYDQVVYRGDLDGREFIALWTREGKVVAGMNANIWDVIPDIERLVRSDEPVDLDRLADTSIPLAEV